MNITPTFRNRFTKEEFANRFKERMVKRVGPITKDGESVAEYADEVSLAYWEDDTFEWDTPEDAADSDMDYWE